MKKSELNKFIREEIISTLSEDIAAMEKELDAYDQKLDAVIQKKEEAGLEEKVAKSVDDVIDPADYVEIGQGYLKAFNRPHSLDDDELETLGRKVVKSLYKGDFDKAKAKFINEVEVDIPSPTMLKYNSGVKDLKTAALAMLDFYNQMQEKEQVNFLKNAQFKLAIDKLKQLSQQKDDPVTEEEDKEEMGLNESIPALEKMDTMKKEIRLQLDSFDKGIIDGDDLANAMEEIVFGERRAPGMREEIDLNEDEDKEPSDAEIKKNKSLAKAAEELAVLTREMKSLAKKYSKAEGQEKEDLLKKLKSKTKLKKELDKILDK